MRVTHKVSERHLHHKQQWQAAMTTNLLHWLPMIGRHQYIIIYSKSGQTMLKKICTLSFCHICGSKVKTQSWPIQNLPLCLCPRAFMFIHNKTIWDSTWEEKIYNLSDWFFNSLLCIHIKRICIWQFLQQQDTWPSLPESTILLFKHPWILALIPVFEFMGENYVSVYWWLTFMTQTMNSICKINTFCIILGDHKTHARKKQISTVPIKWCFTAWSWQGFPPPNDVAF
jgi:hypothetical protein